MYEIIRLVGRGWYSLVYEVKKKELSFLPESLAFKRTFFFCASAVRCALRERQIFRRLRSNAIKSPFLPTLYHSFRIGQSSVLVMTLSSGKSLADLLYQYLPLSEKAASFYIAEIMCALDKLHQLQIVHMDIEPNNILIRQSGHIMLADFDHSNDASFTRSWPKLEYFGGNLKFMAPEVANRVAITTRADVWSLGILAATLVSGSVRPNEDKLMLERMAKQGKYRIRRFARLSIPLQYFIQYCLTRDFAKRPEIYELKYAKFFEPLDWAVVNSCGLRPPIKPHEIVRLADYHIDSRDTNILSAALGKGFPNFSYSLESQEENVSLLEGVRHDPDDLQRAGFQGSRFDELFTNFDFVDSNFSERILRQAMLAELTRNTRRPRTTSI